ncbi:MAG: hypothetical protein O7F73_10185 [Gammaproteobacteria bacterium]|nr:hypothetical protein [Gammaproteobacteria bacterium]
MRVRHVLLSLCISLLTQIVTQIAAATEEEELPALELLGFIADFSDDDEGWVDPQELEELLSLVSDTAEPHEDSEATEEPNTHTAAE